ncbi:MAG: hypothetical protein JXB07_18845 [Anaerolineae bacterium]|nr:hypothetical protein [Anaerolineae bacterium]
MDESLIKTALEAGGMILLAVIVWQFIGVLRLAMNSQNTAYESLRRWFESELKQRDADLSIEKAERMKLESRFDEQCEETERLKTRIIELEKQIEEKVAEIERLNKSIQQLKSNDEKKEARIKEQNERIKELERELHEVKIQRDELVGRLDAILSAKKSGNGGDKQESKIAEPMDEPKKSSVRKSDDEKI